MKKQWEVKEDTQKEEERGGCFIITRNNLLMCRRFVSLFTEMIAVI